EQDQLDRHQDDDHVLPVQKDAEHAEHEQDRADGEVMAEADHDAGPLGFPSPFVSSPSTPPAAALRINSIETPIRAEREKSLGCARRGPSTSLGTNGVEMGRKLTAPPPAP